MRTNIFAAGVAIAMTTALACSDAPPDEQTGTIGQALAPGGGSGIVVQRPGGASVAFTLKPLTSTSSTCVGSGMVKVEFFEGTQRERGIVHSCFPYTCAAGAGASGSCTSSCATHADCALGLACHEGACALRRAFCSGDGLTSLSTTGDSEGCGRYRCNPATGLCPLFCGLTTDCAPSFGCDRDIHQCVSIAVVEDGNGF